MKFSERMGAQPPPLPLNLDEMPPRLRTRLWNALLEEVQSWFDLRRIRSKLPSQLWDEHLARPIEAMPTDLVRHRLVLKQVFDQLSWDGIYDLLEFILQRTPSSRFAVRVNLALEQELAAVRFIDKGFVQVTDSAEVNQVVEALSSAPTEAREHIAQALRSLGSRPKPDTRNAVKEVICALESVAKQITDKPSSTYPAVAQILKARGAHPQFVQAWSNLYSYASDAGGMRHGLKEGEEAPTLAEAKLIVVTGSAFVNYLVTTFP